MKSNTVSFSRPSSKSLRIGIFSPSSYMSFDSSVDILPPMSRWWTMHSV